MYEPGMPVVRQTTRPYGGLNNASELSKSTRRMEKYSPTHILGRSFEGHNDIQRGLQSQCGERLWRTSQTNSVRLGERRSHRSADFGEHCRRDPWDIF